MSPSPVCRYGGKPGGRLRCWPDKSPSIKGSTGDTCHRTGLREGFDMLRLCLENKTPSRGNGVRGPHCMNKKTPSDGRKCRQPFKKMLQTPLLSYLSWHVIVEPCTQCNSGKLSDTPMTHDYPVAETPRLTHLIVNPHVSFKPFEILETAFFFTSTPAFSLLAPMTLLRDQTPNDPFFTSQLPRSSRPSRRVTSYEAGSLLMYGLTHCQRTPPLSTRPFSLSICSQCAAINKHIP